jgi:hypothetical protein
LEIDLTTKVSTIDALQMFDLVLSRKGPIKDLFPLLPTQESDAFMELSNSYDYPLDRLRKLIDYFSRNGWFN